MFPVIETSYDYFCFSYTVFVSASEKKKIHNDFHYYFCIICDSHERTVKMEKKIFFCLFYLSKFLTKKFYLKFLLVICASNRTWICLRRFWRHWKNWFASMAWCSTSSRDEEMGLSDVTQSFLLRTFTVVGTEIHCPTPFVKSHWQTSPWVWEYTHCLCSR